MNSPLPGELIPARQPRPRNKGYFVHGELSKRIYEALRDRETISAAELADKALADKQIDDKRVRANFRRPFPCAARSTGNQRHHRTDRRRQWRAVVSHNKLILEAPVWMNSRFY